MDNTIVVSTPPHVKSKRTTRSIMIDVLIALLPCAIAGIVFFGLNGFVVEVVAIISCVATEFVYFFIQKGGFSNKCKNAVPVMKMWLKSFDCTSVVTGLILALILPSTVNWYEVLIGSVFAIAVVKMVFGGTGKNIVNPAAAARVFMLLSFTLTMNAYVSANFEPIMLESEIYTGATNLAGFLLQGKESAVTVLDLFLGTGVAGSIGETCKAAILLGYAYLVIRKVIKWWIPVLFVAVFGLTAVLMSGMYYDNYTFEIALFLPHVLSGGVLFAAVFMFTDYSTTPKCVWGQVVFIVASALLVAVLRYLTKIEVASFVIILMNLFVPLIDKYIIRKPFGYVKPIKTKEGK